MQRIKPPFPSFTEVMSRNLGDQDSLRLPAFRASHLEKFHSRPRSRAPPPPPYEEHMMTVDYRYGDPPPRSSFALPAIVVENYDIEIEDKAPSVKVDDVDGRHRLKALSDCLFVRI
ncbi:hypothetical protein EW146_g4152 [Bondarzewia mesenterica]|uniref:Uncharacterized protein n=1 Tax=Bondarzewia mesenterica TaxID=1095465 RepID=A0A4S4M184_9AGAM|nr:hypothetical protein EW146_g4152 [Bondarzewia mesenterica]